MLAVYEYPTTSLSAALDLYEGASYNPGTWNPNLQGPVAANGLSESTNECLNESGILTRFSCSVLYDVQLAILADVILELI